MQHNIFWRHSRSVERVVVEQVASRMQGFSFSQDTLSATLHLKPIPSWPVNTMRSIHVTGTVDGQPADMFIPSSVLDRCLDSVAPLLSSVEFDPVTTALLLEVALAEPLDNLEKELGLAITFSKAELCREKSPKWAKPDIVLQVNMGRLVPATAYAYVTADVARKVYAAFMKVTADVSLETSVSLSVRTGIVNLNLDELTNLQPDDIVILDECSLHNKEVYLIADDALGARSSISGTQIKLVEPLVPLAGSWVASYSSAEPNKFKPDAVTIAVDIVRRTITFDELESIDFEREIDLPQGIDGVVGLYQGNRKIASGQLIVVGATIGVRIIGLHPDG